MSAHKGFIRRYWPALTGVGYAFLAAACGVFLTDAIFWVGVAYGAASQVGARLTDGSP